MNLKEVLERSSQVLFCEVRFTYKTWISMNRRKKEFDFYSVTLEPNIKVQIMNRRLREFGFYSVVLEPNIKIEKCESTNERIWFL